MSTTGLEAIDTSLQAAHGWLNEIGEAIGPDEQRRDEERDDERWDEQRCFHALRAVLTALRDQLSVDQSARLAAELPLLVRGIFYEGFRPSAVPMTLRKQDEFVTLVAKRFGNIGPVSPRASTIAVFRVLQRHLTQPLLETVKSDLPQEVRTLFQPDRADAGPGPHRDAAQGRGAQGRSATADSTSRDWGAALSGQDGNPHIRPDKLS